MRVSVEVQIMNSLKTHFSKPQENRHTVQRWCNNMDNMGTVIWGRAVLTIDSYSYYQIKKTTQYIQCRLNLEVNLLNWKIKSICNCLLADLTWVLHSPYLSLK